MVRGLPLVSGPGFAAFSVGPVLVFVIATEPTVEMCRAGGATAKRMAALMEGHPYGLLIDYHAPLDVPERAVRAALATIILENRAIAASARAVVLRGDGLIERGMRAFFRWSLSLASGDRTVPDLPASSVPEAIEFLADHIEGVPRLDEVHSVFVTEYAKLGLGWPDFGAHGEFDGDSVGR